MVRTWTFTIPEHPPSVNRLKGMHWTTRRKLMAPTHDAMALQAMAVHLPAPLPQAHITITLEYRKGPMRDHDGAVGSIKGVLDSLKGSMIVDDSPHHITLDVRQLVTGVKRTVIQIEEVA